MRVQDIATPGLTIEKQDARKAAKHDYKHLWEVHFYIRATDV